ncbi:MAG: amino acid ABC transporter permease [Methanomicrobiales archaeon]|nr:amino acid ABC transporter permease [Methanomicrobiales archaeon]
MDQVTFVLDVMIPAFQNGLLMTLALVAITAPFGLLIGIGVACGRVYGGKGVSWLMKMYAVFFRGCPLLLLLFILYFGLPSFGIVLSPFVASVLGFIFCNSAYNSEYIRGSMISVKEGQLIAAKALGMTRNQAILNIVLPQALRRSIPGVSNEFIYLIKYSSLAYMITVIELTGASKLIATKYFAYNETFFAVAIVYLALVTITTFGANALEKKYAIPG